MLQHLRRRSHGAVTGGAVILALAAPGISAAATVRGSVVLVNPEGQPAKKRDHSGAVIWLEPAAGTTARPAGSLPKQTVMAQRNKMFMPHVMAIEVGTAVDFPNNDAIVHNVFSNYDGQVFDVQMYAPQTAKRVVFRRPGMVRVFCNMHETMSAVIAVLSTAYFAVTDATGRFEIQAPAGEYRLRYWHERAQPDVLSKLERRVSAAEAGTVVPEAQIATGDEAVTPHKDKYGHDYVARADEHIFYPGARR